MKTRKLIGGREAEEFDRPVCITVYTKCPGKWKLTDMETGQVYHAATDSGKIDLLAMIKQGYHRTVKNYYYGTWNKIEKTTE